MRLISEELRQRLPALYATDGSGGSQIVHAKFFTPWTNWTWYLLEFEGEDLCFGLVHGYERELGYFLLSELQSIRGPGGLTVERDDSFVPCSLSELTDRLDGIREQPRLPFGDRSRDR